MKGKKTHEEGNIEETRKGRKEGRKDRKKNIQTR